MEIYKININSSGGNWTDDKRLEGKIYEADGGVTIRYLLDGDECTLTVKDGKVIQVRHGSQYVKISFEEGKTTECIIGNGGLSGSFEVFTRSLKFISGKGGYKLSLEYINGSDKETVKLTLIAVKQRFQELK